MDLALILSNEYIKVEVNQKLSFLQTTWLQQPSSEQFRQQLKLIIDYALTHNINKTLFDIRQRAYLEIADQNWLTREIIPLFVQQKMRFAYVISQTTLAALDIFRIQSKVETNSTVGKQFEMKIFLDKEEALAWLLPAV